MSQLGIARRYAVALFDVVSKRQQLAEARAELEGIVAVIAGHDGLRKALESPAVPPAKKRALVAAIFEAAGGRSAEVRRLLQLLAEHDRLGQVGDVARAFGDRVNQASRVMPAEVVTAVPLQDASRAAIAAALGRATGNEIRITERVDPSIVGGLVARVGSLVFDGSITHQINRLRRKLLAEV